MFFSLSCLEKISFNTCANVSTLCLIHGKEINHAKASPTHTRMIQSLKKAKFIIANSAFTKNLAIKKGIKESQIKIINPGIFTNITVPKNSIKKASSIFENKSPKFISVTRLEKRKGIHSVILALKNIQVLHPKFLYVIVLNLNCNNFFETTEIIPKPTLCISFQPS